MWILPSRLRPHNIKRFLDAAAETEMSTPVYLRLDDDDLKLNDYLTFSYPENWIVVVGERCSVGEIWRRFYIDYPELQWYGALADDVVPETSEWDKRLIEVAGRDGLAHCADGKHFEKFATHFVLGGDLVRDMGGLTLDGLSRIYIDTMWNDIANAREARRYLSNVRLIHHHPSTGLAKRDLTYLKLNNNADRELYIKWKRKGGPDVKFS